MKHPARYTEAFLPMFQELLLGHNCVLDLFGGTGKLKTIRPDAICLDIEPEWARLCGLRANALALPFPNETFDAVCTSPTYGNRMADKTPGRVSYSAYLGRPVHKENSGGMQWGEKYKEFHRTAWREARRVIKTGGILILNMKDHIRAGQRQYVTDWHVQVISEHGFVEMGRKNIATSGAATHLTNGAARVS